MKFSLLRTLWILIIGGYYLYYYIGTFEDEIFFDGIVLSTSVLTFIVSIGYSFLKDGKRYISTKSYVSYVPTLAGVLVLCVVCIASYLLIKKDSSPILLQAGYDGGYNGAWFEFRKDGTYKFANSGGIGATYIRGKYNLNDSIITLDKNNLDRIITTKYLTIRSRKPDSAFQNAHRDIPRKALYQINENHLVIDKEFIFVINKDLRKR